MESLSAWFLGDSLVNPPIPGIGTANGEIHVGRFYRIDHDPQEGCWQWSVYAFHHGPTAETGLNHGVVEGTARDAARMVEETYFRWLAAGMKPWVPDPRWPKLPDPWDK